MITPPRVVCYQQIVVIILLLAEIGLEEFAALSFEPADGLLLDLAHTLAGEVKFGADFLESHLLASDAEEHLEYLALAVVELAQCAVNLS